MSILVNSETRLITQGITGEYGRMHTLACREYGTNVVAGVTPGRGGEDVEGLAVRARRPKLRGEGGREGAHDQRPSVRALDDPHGARVLARRG